MSATKNIIEPTAVEAPSDGREAVVRSPELLGDQRNIHERMIAILGELPAIGKNQWNEQEGFNFRGIDDVLNALNPLLSKHGVYCIPKVIERVYEARETRDGSVMHAVHLHVEYTFYGLRGDWVKSSSWGEGTDMGDKATPKAMTGAMKYALFQAFAISVKEAHESDGDRYTPEETVAKLKDPAPKKDAVELGWPSKEAANAAYTAAVGDLDISVKKELDAWRKKHRIPWPCSPEDLIRVEAWLSGDPDEASH